MTDKCDPPIEEKEFLAGVRVVDIGDYRVARGMTRRNVSSCNHYRVVYDEKERRIWCKDCKHDVEPFDAFVILVKYFAYKDGEIRAREKELEEIESFKMRTLAGKTLDKAWRKKHTAPCCPHCKNGLLPEDFKNGIVYSTSKEYEKAKRKKIKDAK